MSPFKPISEREEYLAGAIVNSALTVHKILGPGLLEQVYEACFCHELAKLGVETKRQISVPIEYEGIQFSEGFRLDVLVEDLIICELKNVENVLPIHKSQLLTYLKLTNKRLGFLINFNVSILKNGIHRIIN